MHVMFPHHKLLYTFNVHACIDAITHLLCARLMEESPAKNHQVQVEQKANHEYTSAVDTECVLLPAATNDSEINDLFSKGGSHTAQSSANPFSGLDSSGLPSSGPRDSGTESSGPQDSRSRSSGSHASGVDGSGPRPSGSSAPVRPDSNKRK